MQFKTARQVSISFSPSLFLSHYYYFSRKMTFIKPDPEILQEEQEDLIMSYLNADYLSTDTPLSPPSSTSSSSETTGSPEKHSVDDFMLDINTDFLGSDQHAWTTNNTTSATTIVANEQPKKRRGRKKRDTTAPAPCVPQPSLLAPKPLAPRPDVQIKQEPMAIDVSSSSSSSPLAGPTSTVNETVAISQLEPQQQQLQQQQQQQQQQTTTPPPSTSQPTSIEAQKQAQIQKRQERLIKNRAAALLSRKRKREHLSLLEEEKQNLLMENETRGHKVGTLENRIQSLEKENMELKEKLEQTQSVNSSNTVIHIGNNKRNLINNGQKPSKATGVVFMVKCDIYRVGLSSTD